MQETRPKHDRVFYHTCLVNYLLSHVFLSSVSDFPVGQRHRNPPRVFSHWNSQPPLLLEHSLTSVNNRYYHVSSLFSSSLSSLSLPCTHLDTLHFAPHNHSRNNTDNCPGCSDRPCQDTLRLLPRYIHQYLKKEAYDFSNFDDRPLHIHCYFIELLL